jgi:oxygen-dependent protoporphyrinogen oxidase
MRTDVHGSESPPRVVVIGGGITGLTAAYRLQSLAREHRAPLDVRLLESTDRLGGKIRTARVDDFIVEEGPDIFLARKPWGVDLCREIGLEARLRPTNPERRGSLILRDGVLYPLPEGLSAMIPTRLKPFLRSPLLSPWGKIRMGADWLLPARSGDADESVAAFFSRRLGRELYEKIVDPLLGGIYGGSGDVLSLKATFPHLRDLEREHGSLLRGLLARRKTPRKNGGAFVTLEGGMEELTATLARKLTGVRVTTGAPVRGLLPRARGFTVVTDHDRLDADAVLLTTPAYVSGALVAPFDDALARELGSIRYGSTVTLSLAYRLADVPRPLDAYGYIVPRSEGRPVLACTWSSTKIPGRAPEGTALLRVFLGRADDYETVGRPDDALLALAREELRATLGITAEPLFHHLHRWERAMPLYTLGHPERLDRIAGRLTAHPGLFLAGAAFHGVGIPDCIRDGATRAAGAFAFARALAASAHSS